MKTIRLILEVFDRKLRWRLVRDTLLVLIEGLVGTAALVTVVPVVDLLLSTQQHASPTTTRLTTMMRVLGLPVSLGGFLTIFFAMQVLKSCVTVAARHCILKTRFAVLRTLIMGTFRDFFNAQWCFFSEGKQGTILNTLLYEISAVGGAVWVMMLLFASLSQIVFYVMLPFYMSWQVTCISLSMAVLFAVPFLLLGSTNYRLGKIGTEATNQVSTVVQESLSMAKIILGFGNQQKSLQALAQAVETQCRASCISLTIQSATPIVYEPLGILALIVTVFAGRRFGIPLSEVAVLFWALRNCLPLVSNVITYRNGLINFAPSYEQIKRLRQRARELQQPSGTRLFRGFQHDLIIEHVTFAYRGHEPVLVDMNLCIPKGTMAAFVGESGVGKSTLVDLIMGFHQPSSGRVLFDGVPLHEFDVNSFHQRLGYVPQDSALFNATIRENLIWAHDTATDEEIKAACRQANADEFIERLQDGYDTVVGDRGVRLSGGQCQRIALARAILRKPELLILDEATSSLDSYSERLIQQAIETVAKETTVLVIAHRLSTIINADYIYVLHQSRIVEEGTYQHLVQQDGHFSRMTQMQLLETAV